MSDNLDNDLKNRIREVFDNYEDDTADAGWELLRQRFPAEEKKRRVIAWWWYSAAAVLLVCFGTWFFYPQTTQQVAIQPKKTKQVVNDSATNNREQVAASKPTIKEGAPSVESTQAVSQQQLAAASTQQTTSLNPQYQDKSQGAGMGNSENLVVGTATAKMPAANTPHIAPTQQGNADAHESIVVFGKNNSGLAKVTNQPAVNNVIVGEVSTMPKFDANAQNTAKIKSQATGIATDSATSAVVAKTNNSPQVASVVVQNPSGQQKGDPVLKMIAADDARRQAIAKNATKKSEAVKSDKAMLLSVYAGTYFNYAKGSESQVNVGAGFTSDFKLSSKFKLSTGLAIAQNKLNYNNDSYVPGKIYASAIANSTASNANMVSASFAYDGLSSLAVNTPTVKNYNANLVGLDIPLNLKYQFNPEKNDTYILAGISSGTYINETYRSTLSYSNYYRNANSLAGVANTSQTQESTNTQHFGTFDFAKTLNLSFGIGYPVGKSNRLIVEPFLKYPLNGLGSQDIRFGASGVNLKLSFSGSKKK
ncbi:outer membrane beta-barrel protein [Mucilaginibacter agri]|uniref:Outer membrane beta-barrel protein n=1 Tax=Mucilaginibacter agri TaxID=2695265 RepID=A0A966DS39_9SPHI|nr:outer membrane beta-barrel protein [Mucilaginibacter agri]NCD67931.1 outer membrane beta-barrel protein [Mucilaginibacter agri]